MSHSIRLGAGALALATVFLAGCLEERNKTTAEAPPDRPPGLPKAAGFGGPPGAQAKGPAKDGPEAAQINGCLNCHSIGAAGGKKGKGPDLSHVGADASHTKEWLSSYIKDPNSVKPMSKMPPQSRISDEDLAKLVDYLVGLK